MPLQLRPSLFWDTDVKTADVGRQKPFLPDNFWMNAAAFAWHTGLLLPLIFLGCNEPAAPFKQESFGTHACTSAESLDTTGVPSYKTVRGALLGTRFNSFEELKSVIQIEYYNFSAATDSTAPESNAVRVRHCSGGREVTSVLEKGINEGDFLTALKALGDGQVGNGFSVLYRCPYAVINRGDLKKMHSLSRRQPNLFGEGDPAFFDLAKASVEHINTPDIAFRNPRDSTEKGYLNSFHHITAQAFATSCFSEELADFIAAVHERHHHPELITGKFSDAQIADLGEGAVDNYVDLINNEWGQELGKQLKQKYGITQQTVWTPELLANFLNDLLSYYSWAFQIGFEPFQPEEALVRRYSEKLNAVMRGSLNYKY